MGYSYNRNLPKFTVDEEIFYGRFIRDYLIDNPLVKVSHRLLLRNGRGTVKKANEFRQIAGLDISNSFATDEDDKIAASHSVKGLESLDLFDFMHSSDVDFTFDLWINLDNDHKKYQAAFHRFYRSNLYLIQFFSKDLSSNIPLNYDDFSRAENSLARSVLYYDPDRVNGANFYNFSKKVIQNELKLSIKRKKSYLHLDYDFDLVSDQVTPLDILEQKENVEMNEKILILFNEFLQTLPEGDRRIVMAKLGMSNEIYCVNTFARELGMHVKSVPRIAKKNLDRFRQMLEV